MKTGWRKGISWAISLILHVALLLLVSVPGGGLSAGSGLEVIEVGFVELGPATSDGRAQQAAAAAQFIIEDPVQEQPELPQQNEQPPQKESTPVKQAQLPQISETVKALPKDNTPGSSGSDDSAAGNNGTSQGVQGSNKGQELGSGEGFVLSRPVTYPKNAQNEGSEGEVLAEVRLTPEGEIQVVLLSTSGDQRLDSYSLRALKEAWQYTRPAFPVKIRVALIFRSGEVRVVFQGSERWEGSGAQP